MLFFSRTCREIATLLVAQEDRVLPWADRLAMRIHLSVCQTCPRFERQILTMRHSFQRWRNYAEDESGPQSHSTSTNKN